jgi:hypothetical protein
MKKLRVNLITPLSRRTTSFKRSTTAILLGIAFRSSPFRSTNTATVPKVRLPGCHFLHFVYYSSHLLVLFLAEEYHQIKEQAAAMVESPPLIEEEIIIVDEPNLKIIDATEVIDEARFLDESEALEQPKVEIIDEAVDLVAKYEAIESVEERAFEVLKDMGFVKPAPQHFSFSYVHEIPELRLEAGTSYLDALGNPDVSAINGAGSMTSYLGSIPSSDSNTFAKGKSGKKLGATTSYLDDICDMIEPFLDLEQNCGKAKAQPLSPQEEDLLGKKYAAIMNVGDRAFQILVDLCMVGRCKKN